MTRDSDTVFFKERHLVPALVVQSGLAKFNLMLEMNAPGTVPDPLLIAALIDLVSTYIIIVQLISLIWVFLALNWRFIFWKLYRLRVETHPCNALCTNSPTWFSWRFTPECLVKNKSQFKNSLNHNFPIHIKFKNSGSWNVMNGTQLLWWLPQFLAKKINMQFSVRNYVSSLLDSI